MSIRTVQSNPVPTRVHGVVGVVMPLAVAATISQAQSRPVEVQELWNQQVEPCHTAMVEIDNAIATVVRTHSGGTGN